MLNTQAQGELRSSPERSDFELQVKIFRIGTMIALGLFAGTVLGGVIGLFVYANSRTPNVHDGVFAIIQVLGVLAGLAMGFLAARSVEAQEQLIEASQRAGLSMLRKYRPKPGANGHHGVGQRVIGGAAAKAASSAGEEFLKTLLNGTK